MSWDVAEDEASVERYFARLPLPTRTTARELDALVRKAVPKARVGMKWSVPFYAQKGPVCYISAARAHVTFGLLNGVDIEDASGRLVGTGKSPIRKVKLLAGEPVPATLLRGWLRQAKRLDAHWGEH